MLPLAIWLYWLTSVLLAQPIGRIWFNADNIKWRISHFTLPLRLNAQERINYFTRTVIGENIGVKFNKSNNGGTFPGVYRISVPPDGSGEKHLLRVYNQSPYRIHLSDSVASHKHSRIIPLKTVKLNRTKQTISVFRVSNSLGRHSVNGQDYIFVKLLDELKNRILSSPRFTSDGGQIKPYFVIYCISRRCEKGISDLFDLAELDSSVNSGSNQTSAVCPNDNRVARHVNNHGCALSVSLTKCGTEREQQENNPMRVTIKRDTLTDFAGAGLDPTTKEHSEDVYSYDIDIRYRDVHWFHLLWNFCLSGYPNVHIQPYKIPHRCICAGSHRKLFQRVTHGHMLPFDQRG